jgi:5-methylcytosine-specific restriction endonuclease McrA
MAYWGNCCWMCSGEYQEVDHVIPLARGGLHCLSNLRPACRSCNASKGAKRPSELLEVA